MKVMIAEDSWYPVYTLGEPIAEGVEVPDDLYRRFEANLQDFDAIQAEIKAIYESSPGNSDYEP